MFFNAFQIKGDILANSKRIHNGIFVQYIRIDKKTTVATAIPASGAMHLLPQMSRLRFIAKQVYSHFPYV
jgi:hypothetical protein